MSSSLLPWRVDKLSEEQIKSYGLGSKSIYHADIIEELELLEKLLVDFIGADCHAMTFNNDVLFNAYPSEVYSDVFEGDIRKDMIGDVIRDRIVDDIRGNLFTYIFNRSSKKKSASICIYMFQVEPWMIEVTYDPETKEFKLQYWACKLSQYYTK